MVVIGGAWCVGIENVGSCGEAGDLFGGKRRTESRERSSGGSRYEDIDNDHSDPQMCTTYATDIYAHLRMAEVRA